MFRVPGRGFYRSVNSDNSKQLNQPQILVISHFIVDIIGRNHMPVLKGLLTLARNSFAGRYEGEVQPLISDRPSIHKKFNQPAQE
jgi:hypothetical protein